MQVPGHLPPAEHPPQVQDDPGLPRSPTHLGHKCRALPPMAVLQQGIKNDVESLIVQKSAC